MPQITGREFSDAPQVESEPGLESAGLLAKVGQDEAVHRFRSEAKPFATVEPFNPSSGGAPALAGPKQQEPGEKKVWTDGSLTPVNRSTIACDGEGGIQIEIAPGHRSCAEPCVIEHEKVHLADAMAINPTVCEDDKPIHLQYGKPKGTQILTQRHLKFDAEVRAGDAEVACLEKKLRALEAAGKKPQDPEVVCLTRAKKHAEEQREMYRAEARKYQEEHHAKPHPGK